MRWLAAVLATVGALSGCSGSSGGGGASACTGACPTTGTFLTEADVQRVIAQAAGEAQARGVGAVIAVVDRSGNVLAVFATADATNTISILSGLGVVGGLDGIQRALPSTFAAITKALTGAYLSSQGNAFSTRTASQIVQEHFNPNEANQPSGPLYGVQFSQLSCSDVNRNLAHGDVGPKRSPLGLAADPGGLPLYKNGVLVGGIGIESDGLYGLDRDIRDIDSNVEEIVAVSGSAGFAAPADIRGDRITADGRTFRYVDSESLLSDPARAPAFGTLRGLLVPIAGYTDATIRRGTEFGTASSGVRPDTGPFASGGGWILVDAANVNRFPPRDAVAPGGGDLRANEVSTLLAEALAIAYRARGQIRRPLGSSAHVTISIVDRNGDILGLVRTSDGPVFGIDVAVQKARTAMFFSHPDWIRDLLSAPVAIYLGGKTSDIGHYATRMRLFTGENNLAPGNSAWSARAIGNLHRPFFPDGIEGTPEGPLSKPIGEWSPFNVGLQLDLVNNQLLRAAALGDLAEGCAGRTFNQPEAGGANLRKVRNGIQIFPGGVPIYRGNVLVGGIGVSGDGVDQDDMIAFLGVANAGRALNGALGNAPAAMRADTLTPLGVRLRYVQCPQAPFNGSTEQNVCAGL